MGELVMVIAVHTTPVGIVFSQVTEDGLYACFLGPRSVSDIIGLKASIRYG
jgi:hypothetical protein